MSMKIKAERSEYFTDQLPALIALVLRAGGSVNITDEEVSRIPGNVLLVAEYDPFLSVTWLTVQHTDGASAAKKNKKRTVGSAK